MFFLAAKISEQESRAGPQMNRIWVEHEGSGQEGKLQEMKEVDKAKLREYVSVCLV